MISFGSMDLTSTDIIKREFQGLFRGRKLYLYAVMNEKKRREK